MTKLYSFEEIALAVGRFEMESKPRLGNYIERSVMTFEEVKSLGLLESAAIYATQPEVESVRRVKLLDALGNREGKRWRLRVPVSAKDRLNWSRLVDSNQVIVFFAPPNNLWLENLISKLFDTYVFTVPSTCLTEDWIKFERSKFSGLMDGLHVSAGATRSSFTFIGVGPQFARAVSLAAKRPQGMWGYTPSAFKETLRTRKLFFRETKK